MTQALRTTEWVILGYFVSINSVYLILEALSLLRMTGYLRERALDDLPRRYSEHDPLVSIVVPAYNEETVIETTVKALLQLDYREFEVIVVNDGSTDGTVSEMVDNFQMEAEEEYPSGPLPSRHIRAVYRSKRHPHLRLLDKENGGKADALNAGVNAASYPLICGVDADSVLQRDTLRRLARPFIDDPRTVAVGGTLRVANGCKVSDGLFQEAGLSRNLLALIQVVEYLRAFLFGRFAWDAVNAVLIISGALGMFDRDTLLRIGGYRSEPATEDLELTVRIHRILVAERRPYRVAFIPDPIAWTEVPEDLRTLGRQRMRWHRGLADGLWMNRSLLFKPGSSVAGWINFPFQLVFECFGPIIEVGGYLYFVIALVTHHASLVAIVAFAILAIGVGMLLSTTSLLLEELSFRLYPKLRHVGALLLAVIAENFFYRQVNSFWRTVAVVRWLLGHEASWGHMPRRAAVVDRPPSPGR